MVMMMLGNVWVMFVMMTAVVMFILMEVRICVQGDDDSIDEVMMFSVMIPIAMSMMMIFNVSNAVVNLATTGEIVVVMMVIMVSVLT